MLQSASYNVSNNSMHRTTVVLFLIVGTLNCCDQKAANEPLANEKVSVDQPSSDDEEPTIIKIEINSFGEFVSNLPKIDLPYNVNCKPRLDFQIDYRDEKLIMSDELQEATRGVVAFLAERDSLFYLLRLEPADIALPFVTEYKYDGTMWSEEQLLSLRHCAHDDIESMDFNSSFTIGRDLEISRIDLTFDATTGEVIDSVYFDLSF